MFSFHSQSPKLGKLLEREVKELALITDTHHIYIFTASVFMSSGLKKNTISIFHGGVIGLISNFDCC